MPSPTLVLKDLTPPVFYRCIENLYRKYFKPRIDSSNKFLGKLFCIGFNKTGTTSVEKALGGFGYRLGNQTIGAMLLTDWHKGDYSRLIRFCQGAQAFQDIPFSLPGTYRHLDVVFPDAKFILTVRDSEEQWYQSMVRFHTKRFSSDKNRLPDVNDLENTGYPYKGFTLDLMKMVFGFPTVRLYDHDYYTGIYRQHNHDAIQYFTDRPDKLLILNVSEPNAYQELASFLNVRIPENTRFPWENRT